MALTRREFSAGGVVYKKSAEAARVALIAKRGRTVWCLPKGKIEKDETPEAAATREIREETGLAARPIKLLGDIFYQYISSYDKARVSKKVRFFLFEYQQGSISKHGDPDNEVDEVAWFEISEALRLMTYPSEKKIMETALREIV